jgi:hypothetical protein
MSEAPALRFRNGDMVVEGSNESLEAATSASSHAMNCTRTPHMASKPSAPFMAVPIAHGTAIINIGIPLHLVSQIYTAVG